MHKSRQLFKCCCNAPDPRILIVWVRGRNTAIVCRGLKRCCSVQMLMVASSGQMPKTLMIDESRSLKITEERHRCVVSDAGYGRAEGERVELIRSHVNPLHVNALHT